MRQGGDLSELREERPQPADGMLGGDDRRPIGVTAPEREITHLGAGIRAVVEPPLDEDPLDPTGHHQHATVLQLGEVGDAGDGPDVDPLVAAADLGATGDEDHPERSVGGHAVPHQRLVPLLEDVQREGGVGKEHGGQGEHPHGAAHRSRHAGSAGPDRARRSTTRMTAMATNAATVSSSPSRSAPVVP